MSSVTSSTVVQRRPHQVDAVSALTSAFRSGRLRAQLRMACGTGKTLIGPWLAEDLGARTVLVFEPSIALVAQTIEQWRRCELPVRFIAVCSDPTARAGRDEVGVDGIDPYAGVHDGPGVTTQSGVLARFLDQSATSSELTVVVGTYHSAPVVAEAFRLTDHLRRADLIVADEAHHLAGRTDDRFVHVLREDRVPARWRLFQTATPVVMGNLAVDPLDDLSGATSRVRSMDDESVFGPVVYDLPAGEAIGRGLLADYRVVVAAPHAGSSAANVPERAALAALADTVSKYGVRRILTFHNRVAAARNFASRVDEMGEIGGVPVRGYAVDGSMTDADRRGILDALADSDDGRTVTVVASSQCLREGIDVPAVDAVVFADPRASITGIVQAIGRALRKHPGKTIGTVVIPLVVEAGEDDQERLSDSDYRHVWRVLRGLRAHDSRVGFDLDRARASTSVGGAAIPWLEVLGDDPASAVARLLERTSSVWEAYYGLLVETARRRGGASAIVSSAVIEGKPLGMWILNNRRLYAEDLLDADRVRRLEQVAGWRWDGGDAADERSLAVLDEIIAERGSLVENVCGESIYAGRRDGVSRPLDQWVANQLFKHADGVLAPWLSEELDRRPGWVWEPLAAEDGRPFEAFRQFAMWEGHADVPDDHVENDHAIGEWIQDVRRRKVMGVVSPALVSMLIAATPTGKKGERRFLWKTPETWWQMGCAAARQYVARVGTIESLPVGHVEVLDHGHNFALYQWVTRLRHRYHRGQVSASQIADIEQITGWHWTGEQAGRGRIQVERALDLGGTAHGRRGFAAGCHCQTCVDANRAYTRGAARNTIERYRAGWVVASDAAAHLKALMDTDSTKDRTDRVVTVGAIAAAAGVGVGLVRGLVNGKTDRCPPLHRQALLAVTVADVHAVRTVKGSRGRTGIEGHGEKVAPAPTWALVDELVEHGWTVSAISTALGYARRSTLPFTRDSVNASQAKMVRMMYDSLGGVLTPPVYVPAPRKRRSGTPVNKFDTEGEEFARSLLEQGYRNEHAARLTGLSIAQVASIRTTVSSAAGAA